MTPKAKIKLGHPNLRAASISLGEAEQSPVLLSFLGMRPPHARVYIQGRGGDSIALSIEEFDELVNAYIGLRDCIKEHLATGRCLISSVPPVAVDMLSTPDSESVANPPG